MKSTDSTHAILQRSLWSVLVLTVVIGLGVTFWWGEDVDTLIAQMDPTYFAWAIVLLSAGLPTVAMRWRSLLASQERKRTKPLFMTGLLMLGHLLNVGIPGPVGEVVTSWIVHKRYDVEFGNSLSALLVSRILGLISAFLIAVVVFTISPIKVAEEYVDKLWVVSVLLLALGGLASSVVLFPEYPRNILTSVRKYTWLQGRFLQRGFDLVDQLLVSFIDTAKRGWLAYGEAFFWCVLGHSMVASGIFCTVLALGYDVAWTGIFFTYSSSIIFSLVMFMLPGSTLGFDVLFSGMLHVTGGIPLPVAVLVASVIRLHQSLIAVLGGVMLVFTSQTLLDEALAFAKKYVTDGSTTSQE